MSCKSLYLKLIYQKFRFIIWALHAGRAPRDLLFSFLRSAFSVTIMLKLVFALVTCAGGAAASTVPTPRQLEYMDMGFTQFMHFSVTTFGKVATGRDVEHDCVNGKCLPAKAFNPSNISTDQWVRTAKAMGAGEICLTAHHEARSPLLSRFCAHY
eukprot:SAG31_NODE_2406_length_5762_cov_6.711107_4_plen_155_part_00